MQVIYILDHNTFVLDKWEQKYFKKKKIEYGKEKFGDNYCILQ